MKMIFRAGEITQEVELVSYARPQVGPEHSQDVIPTLPANMPSVQSWAKWMGSEVKCILGEHPFFQPCKWPKF